MYLWVDRIYMERITYDFLDYTFIMPVNLSNYWNLNRRRCGVLQATGAIEDDHYTKLGYKYLFILQVYTNFTTPITATSITKMINLPALTSLPNTLSSLVPPDAERKPYPPWLEPVFILSCAVVFLQTSRLVRVSWYLGVVLPLATQMLQYTKGNLIDNYVAGLTIPTTVIRVLDLALCHETQREFWKIRGSASKKENEGKGWPQGIFAKVRWAFELLVSLRAIGWNIQVKNVSTDSSQGRGKLYIKILPSNHDSNVTHQKKQSFHSQASYRLHRCLSNP